MSTRPNTKAAGSKPPRPPSLFVLVKPYKGLVAALAALPILANALTLAVPKLIARAIDQYRQPGFALGPMINWFLLVSVAVFFFSYLQGTVQTYAAERVAKDLRTRLAAKLATQSYNFVEKINPAKLLTNLTSDIDGVNMFVSMHIETIISSIVLIVRFSMLVLYMD